MAQFTKFTFQNSVVISLNEITNTEFPSLKRLLAILKNEKSTSVVRALQYERLFEISFDGRLLDIGGGETAHYRDVLFCNSYESINISSSMKPTWIADVEGEFPIPDDTFDHVLSMNTFEHVFDAHKLLSEGTRVLRSGGYFVAATPFMFRVHGSPEDYFRPTASWWIKSLRQNGYDDISVTPLLWGPFSTGALCSGMPGKFKRLRLLVAMLLDVLYARLKFKPHREVGILDAEFQNAPLAYFICAKKI